MYVFFVLARKPKLSNVPLFSILEQLNKTLDLMQSLLNINIRVVERDLKGVLA